MYEMTEQVLVQAPVGAVWHDLTDASALEDWYWPARLHATAVVDLERSGRWEVRSEAGGIAVLGRVHSADAPRELHLDWRWEGEERISDVVIALTPITGVATRVLVRHSGFPTVEERDLHIEGWSQCLHRLVERHEPQSPDA